MSYMFYGCKNLNYLNLSSFNDKNVTDMSYMFYGCQNLNNINLSSFGTKNVTNMSYMFYECKNLYNIDLYSFDTKNVTNMSRMFYGCESLNNIDLSSFNTKNLTDKSSMFDGCRNLNNLNLSSFNAKNLTDISSILNGCKNLYLSSYEKIINFKKKNAFHGLMLPEIKEVNIPEDTIDLNNIPHDEILCPYCDKIPEILKVHGDNGHIEIKCNYHGIIDIFIKDYYKMIEQLPFIYLKTQCFNCNRVQQYKENMFLYCYSCKKNLCPYCANKFDLQKLDHCQDHLKNHCILVNEKKHKCLEHENSYFADFCLD